MKARPKTHNALRRRNHDANKRDRKMAREVIRSALLDRSPPVDGSRDRRHNSKRMYSIANSQFKPSSINTEERSVVAVVSTPTPVRIWDRISGQEVDEVLVPRGCKPMKPTMRMLNSHNKWSVDAVLGTVSEISPTDKTVQAKLTFSSASDVEPIFTKVAEGHLTDVSVRASYYPADFVEIAPGKSRSIGGVTYTAADVTMRIVKKWTPEEVSIVAYGADENSTIRQQTPLKNATPKNVEQINQFTSREDRHDSTGEEFIMRLNAKAMRFLVRRGLSRKANAAVIQNFAQRMSAIDQQRLLSFDSAASILLGSPSTTSRGSRTAGDDGDDSDTGDASTHTGSDSSTGKNSTSRQKSTQSSETTERSADQIRKEERERVQAIRQLASPEIPEKLVDKAIDEGLSPETAGSLFYKHIRERSQRHVPNHNAGRTGIHVKRGTTIESLQGAMLLKHGHKLDSELFQGDSGQAMLNNEARWLTRSASRLGNDMPLADKDEAVMEDAHKYRNRSTVDVCRFALKAEGRKVPSDNREVIRAAMSSSILPRVFGPLINAQVLKGYEEYPDSTEGWVQRMDVADLRATEMIMIEASNSLDEITPGVEAQDLELQESGGNLRVRPFGKRFVFDEDMALMDQIGIEIYVLEKFGQLCRSMAPDLVYATLLANAALSDNVALFDASHANIASGTDLNGTVLGTLENLIASQTIVDSQGGSKALNLTSQHLIVSRKNRYTAKQITGSATVTSAAGNLNPLSGEYVVHSDARIGVGVRHPITKNWIAGNPKFSYLAATNGDHGLKLGFLAGTGRAPLIRSQPLAIPGRWGYGWDVKHYIGIGVADYRGLARNTDA